MFVDPKGFKLPNALFCKCLPNILTSQPYSLHPAFPVYPTYPTYPTHSSSPVAQPGPYIYNTPQQPSHVPPTLQGPYGFSLFQEIEPLLPVQQSHHGVDTQTLFTPSTVQPNTLIVTPPQKRSVNNSTHQNLLKKSSRKEPTGTKQLPPEIYVPEDKYLPPTLHRFPHDTFPYDENRKHPNMLPVGRKTENSLNEEIKNCSSGVSCLTSNQGRGSVNQEDVERNDEDKRTTEPEGILSSDIINPNLQEEKESQTDPQDQLSLDHIDWQMKYNLLNVSTPTSTTVFVSGGNEDTLKTKSFNIHPEDFENQDVHNSRRDTHSSSFVDSSKTSRRDSIKTHPCRCFQKLKKCVHDAKSMAEHLVKKACSVFGDLEEYDD